MAPVLEPRAIRVAARGIEATTPCLSSHPGFIADFKPLFRHHDVSYYLITGSEIEVPTRLGTFADRLIDLRRTFENITRQETHWDRCRIIGPGLKPIQPIRGVRPIATLSNPIRESVCTSRATHYEGQQHSKSR